ncbi:MAG: ATP-binding protein [Myxococcales bacterium]
MLSSTSILAQPAPWALLAAALAALCLGLWLRARRREARHAAELSRLRDELTEARAAADARGEFLANMSHELRTPMSSVIGFADLLEATELDDSQRDYVHTIVRSGRSMVRLVDDILDLSKIEAGKIELQHEPFNLADCIVEASQNLQAVAERKGIANRVRCPASLDRGFAGDAMRIRQVLTNLIGNAIKFTQEGEVVTSASLEREQDDRWWIRLSVRDTGVGIPEDRLSAIFESFSQAGPSTSREFGGTGLGLAISQRLVRLMGGEIGVDSRLGEGSTFWVVLPLSPLRGHSFRPARPQEVPAPLGRAVRVLLAEDDVTNRRFIQMTLSRIGCQVELASDGRQAVDMVRERDYALIFMDLQMPTLDGFDATREIRALQGPERRTPIVAVTAHVMPGVRERCADAGMDAFLPKPVSYVALREVIERCLQLPIPERLSTTPPPAA